MPSFGCRILLWIYCSRTIRASYHTTLLSPSITSGFVPRYSTPLRIPWENMTWRRKSRAFVRRRFQVLAGTRTYLRKGWTTYHLAGWNMCRWAFMWPTLIFCHYEPPFFSCDDSAPSSAWTRGSGIKGTFPNHALAGNQLSGYKKLMSNKMAKHFYRHKHLSRYLRLLL